MAYMASHCGNIKMYIRIVDQRIWRKVVGRYRNGSFSFQLRRQARLRREYLYRKSVEDKERSILERKRKLRDAVEGM